MKFNIDQNNIMKWVGLGTVLVLTYGFLSKGIKSNAVKVNHPHVDFSARKNKTIPITDIKLADDTVPDAGSVVNMIDQDYYSTWTSPKDDTAVNIFFDNSIYTVTGVGLVAGHNPKKEKYFKIAEQKFRLKAGPFLNYYNLPPNFRVENTDSLRITFDKGIVVSKLVVYGFKSIPL